LSSEETVSFSLELNVEQSETQIRKVQTIVYGYLGILRRMGLPPEVDAMIAKMQQVVMIANQARLALLALQAVRLASGDPFAWAMMGLAVFNVGYSAGDFITRM